MKPIIVYSKPGCGQCLFLKNYLKQQGLVFQERNISENPSYIEELKLLNCQSLPVALVGSESPIIGFNPVELQKVLSQC